VRCTELDSECLGAHFARLQMHAFFTAFLARLPPVELDDPVQRLT
jgi:cytochrome P450